MTLTARTALAAAAPAAPGMRSGMRMPAGGTGGFRWLWLTAVRFGLLTASCCHSRPPGWLLDRTPSTRSSSWRTASTPQCSPPAAFRSSTCSLSRWRRWAQLPTAPLLRLAPPPPLPLLLAWRPARRRVLTPPPAAPSTRPPALSTPLLLMPTRSSRASRCRLLQGGAAAAPRRAPVPAHPRRCRARRGVARPHGAVGGAGGVDAHPAGAAGEEPCSAKGCGVPEKGGRYCCLVCTGGTGASNAQLARVGTICSYCNCGHIVAFDASMENRRCSHGRRAPEKCVTCGFSDGAAGMRLKELRLDVISVAKEHNK